VKRENSQENRNFAPCKLKSNITIEQDVDDNIHGSATGSRRVYQLARVGLAAVACRMEGLGDHCRTGMFLAALPEYGA
jgi:hypothetical protein